MKEIFIIGSGIEDRYWYLLANPRLSQNYITNLIARKPATPLQHFAVYSPFFLAAFKPFPPTPQQCVSLSHAHNKTKFVMDEDRIGLVLAKTSELRSKIANCIRKTTSNVGKEGKESEFKNCEEIPEAESQENDDYEEAESLLNIRDALESLEGQLSSLQALQQQQWYEKEAALAEIEYSQKKLLKELKEYKGKDLEVIREAISFASETEDSNDLPLPPYPNRPSHSAVSDNGYLSSFPSTSKFTQNGATTGGLKNLNGLSKNLHKSGRDHGQSMVRGPFDRVKALMGVAAKTALTIVGVITILSMAGFEPRLRKRDNQSIKVLDLFQLQRDDEYRNTVECPPGKVVSFENGEVRCVVKERVEIPFESVVATPDVNYGCG